MGWKARKRRHRERIPPLVLVTGVIAVGLFATLMVKIVRDHDRNLRLQEQLRASPLPVAPPEWNPKWPPLPEPHDPPPRSVETVRGAYAFAARKADVLQYIPCYCGCERHGHRSNLNCYVKGWNADGQPNWDDHSLGCGVCLDITADVMRLDAAGTPLPEIREAIEATYAPRYGRGTPTPRPIPQ